MTPPLTAAARQKAFIAARRIELKRANAAGRQTLDNARRTLQAAEKRIAATLKNSPTEWQSYHLPRLQKEISAALAEAETALNASLAENLPRFAAMGRDLVETPLSKAGVNISAITPRVDLHQLMAMEKLTTHKMDISTRTVKRINDQLGLVISGVQTPSQATDAIQGLLHGDRSRALSVVRTELNTAYAAATQERMEAASGVLPGLEKEWRKSGKLKGRLEHAIVDGQIRKVDEPFDVGGEKLMYPRDPSASLKNRANCGCQSLPRMSSWEVSNSGDGVVE